MTAVGYKEAHEPLLAAPVRRLPGHLVPLGSSGEWALWRAFCLRGTGFPSSWVVELAAPPTASAADRCRRMEATVDEALATALATVNRALDSLRSNGLWHESSQRKPLLGALRALKRGKRPKPVEDSEVTAAVDTWWRRTLALREAREEYSAAFAAGVEQTSAVLHRLASDTRFREAVIWQNQQAYRTGVEPLLRRSPADTRRNSQRRQHEELVASYLQRYCLKNDTIGFFGPSGWGTFSEDGPALRVEPGEDLLATRSVYFEWWCIEALAGAIEQELDLRPWMAPWLSTEVWLDGRRLHLGRRGVIELAERELALVEACDGLRSATVIAAQLVADPANGFNLEEDVFEALERLSAKKAIIWKLRVPTTPGGELSLVEQLARIDDSELRRTALDRVEELTSARADVAGAAGDPEALDRALVALDERFRDVTGSRVTRGAGRTYVGRTLVYEDCRRDVDLEIGPAVRDALAPTLELMLISARWYSQAFRRSMSVLFRQIYSDLEARAGSGEVDVISFWYRLMPRILKGDPLQASARAEFQERWARIFRLPAGERRVQYTSDELRSRVLQAFDASGPGWPMARYHCPDVMIAASSAEAVERGDYLLVMGEVHPSTNTLNSWVFLSEHPDSPEVARWLDRDRPEPAVWIFAPRQWPGMTTRTQDVLISPQDYVTGMYQGIEEIRGAQVLPLGELVVEDAGGTLQVRSRDGAVAMKLADFFGSILSGLLAPEFKIFDHAAHSPRVTIDRLVIRRESWCFTAPEVTFADLKTAEERFQATRGWAEALEMPRFVFVKAPVEDKPFYLDFESPIFVEIFARVVRRSRKDAPEEAITITEMLPTPDQTWLVDSEGHRYTSELRVVALDLASEVG